MSSPGTGLQPRQNGMQPGGRQQQRGIRVHYQVRVFTICGRTSQEERRIQIEGHATKKLLGSPIPLLPYLLRLSQSSG